MKKLQFNEMTEFELDEISSVDRPAQTPAKALIMKNTEGEKPDVEDLTELSGNSLDAAMSGGQDTGEIPMTKTAEETAAQAEAVEKRIQDAEARAQKAEQLATLTDMQKAYHGTLSGADQDSFLAASPDERQAQVEKAAGEDPVVYTTLDGQEIRKSAGDLVLSLAKRADKAEQDVAIEKAAREREVFAKRAKDELSNLPGDESVQVALLKAIDGIPSQSDKDGALAILKAANEGVTKAFETAGSVDGNITQKGDAEAQLEKLATDRAASSGETFVKAYRAVLMTPEGRELFKQTR